MNKLAFTSVLPLCVALSSCGTQPMSPSSLHIKAPNTAAGNIPEPVQQSANLSRPKAAPTVETYSVSVYKVQVQSLLFALARDAKVNIDIHPGITGEVTLNALNQTLPSILDRIAKQVDMRYELNGSSLSIMPDAPFLRNYKIDYVNISRHTNSVVNIATQIASSGGSVLSATGAGGGSGSSNNSTTAVENKSDNDFWATLVKNITDMLRETDKLLPGATDASPNGVPPANSAPSTPTIDPTTAGSSHPVIIYNLPNKAPSFREAASVIANPENGLIAVRATTRQHERIQEFLDIIMASARRQVLIEATVVEVQLSDQYQQGINWSTIRTAGSVVQGQVNNVALSSLISPGTSAGIFTLKYADPNSILGSIATTVQLLESFGKVKVVSSPKISVLNNQTAMLKVVDNNVYFSVTATTTPGSFGVLPTTTYTSTLNTVPVGFVMSVTPQITDSDDVSLNVRPSISRIIGYVQDPNPALTTAVPPVVSNVPVIQSREMESILKVTSGQIAVMGGLMQDDVNNTNDSVPVLGKIPVIGSLFGYRNDRVAKSELVIFIRPVVIKDASISGDYKEFRGQTPGTTPLNQKPYGDETSTATQPKPTDVAATKSTGSGS